MIISSTTVYHEKTAIQAIIKNSQHSGYATIGKEIFTLVAENALAHTIGGRIRALREDRGVTQLELKAALSISTSALRNLEYGHSMPSLNTLVLLSDFFEVSIDYIVRGVTPDGGGSGDNLDLFRATGLNDTSMAFLRKHIDIGKNCGKLDEYITSLNALVSNDLLQLVWSLNVLNRELADVDAQIKKALEENPKRDIIENIVNMSDTLPPLRERRDLLKLRYLRQVEKVFDSLTVEGVE
jgi:transcriptional regulator with XRE-family HTH domain